MGGKLTLDDEIGGGSRFVLTLPLRIGEQEDSDATLPAPGMETGLAPFVGARSNEAEDRGRVLVAEDHDVNQLLIVAMLEQLGWAVDIAADGSEAIAMVHAARERNQPYRMVLMDVQMPVLDGPEATRRLRAQGIEASELPIVALTANAYADDIAACLAAGMQAHVAKPVTLASLDAVLREWSEPFGVPTIPAIAEPPTAVPKSNIRERYSARKQETVEALDLLVRRGLFSDTELAEVSGLLHKLAGTAAMFQEADLGDRARDLEDGIEEWDGEDRPDRIRAAVQAIREAA
jgi:CheY-like chemotaxis protein